MEYDTVSLSLQLVYVNKDDYGDYTCKARNRMGIDKDTMVLYGKLNGYTFRGDNCQICYLLSEKGSALKGTYVLPMTAYYFLLE